MLAVLVLFFDDKTTICGSVLPSWRIVFLYKSLCSNYACCACFIFDKTTICGGRISPSLRIGFNKSIILNCACRACFISGLDDDTCC